MPQISLYVDDATMESLRTHAAQSHMSLSKYTAAAITELAAASTNTFSQEWFDDIYGSIPNFPTLEEIRTGLDDSLDDTCDWFDDVLPA